MAPLCPRYAGFFVRVSQHDTFRNEPRLFGARRSKIFETYNIYVEKILRSRSPNKRGVIERVLCCGAGSSTDF